MKRPMTDEEREKLEEAIKKSVSLPPNYQGGGPSALDHVHVDEYDDGRLVIGMNRMYDRWSLTLDHLEAIAKAVGTDAIDVGDEIERPGCDTCDYGSEYGHVITVWRNGRATR